MPSTRTVRVYQEDWWPFQNLPVALRAFTEATGITTELSWDKVGVGSIETMFEHMTHSFTDDDPPYDLICTDEVILRPFASQGRVHVLNERMARDGITLDDVTAATRDAAMRWPARSTCCARRHPPTRTGSASSRCCRATAPGASASSWMS